MFKLIKKILSPYKRIYMFVRFVTTPLRYLRRQLQVTIMVNNYEKSFKASDRSKHSVYYFGLPEHDNLGDIGQAFCINKWIDENFPGCNKYVIKTRMTKNNRFIKYLKHNLKLEDIIIFQSGYCTRDGNSDHLMHKKIVRLFPQNKIVFLPQTVNMKEKSAIMDAKDVFSRGKRLLFIARDEVSREKAKDIISNREVECFPDIVTSLIGRMDTGTQNRNGVLVCVRNDDEKFYSDTDISHLVENLKHISDKVEISDTNTRYDVEYTYNHLEKVIIEMIQYFGKFKVIITDRFHGTIFSLIANTPVIVIKSNDHKVVSGVNWFKSFEKDSVQIAETLDEAVTIATRIINEDIEIENPTTLYDTFYKDKLMRLIQEL